MGIGDDLRNVLEDIGELITDAGYAIIEGAEDLTMRVLDELEEAVEAGKIFDLTHRDPGDILYHD